MFWYESKKWTNPLKLGFASKPKKVTCCSGWLVNRKTVAISMRDFNIICKKLNQSYHQREGGRTAYSGWHVHLHKVNERFIIAVRSAAESTLATFPSLLDLS